MMGRLLSLKQAGIKHHFADQMLPRYFTHLELMVQA